jgi:hypothetical protein
MWIWIAVIAGVVLVAAGIRAYIFFRNYGKM